MSIEVRGLREALEITKAVRKAAKNAIETGLDRTLNQELEKLKQDMLRLINSQDTIIPIQVGDKLQNIKAKESDIEIIKHFTGADLEKTKKLHNFNTLVENKVSVLSSKRIRQALADELSAKSISPMSSAANVRMLLGESDTLESHLARADNYFNSCIFVLFDDNGKAHYYKNNGINLSKYIKVVCSNTPGNSERAQEVFNRHKTGERPGNRKDSTRTPRDFVDYSLSSEAVRIIKEKFIDLTPAIEKMKYGEFDEAKEHINKIAKESDAIDMLNKIDEFGLGKQLSKTSEAYRNLITMLKNLKLKKVVKKGRTYYELTTSADTALKNTKDLENRIKNEIKVWKIDGRYKWTAKLMKSYIKEVNRLMR